MLKTTLFFTFIFSLVLFGLFIDAGTDGSSQLWDIEQYSILLLLLLTSVTSSVALILIK